jgi:hypothetical protein
MAESRGEPPGFSITLRMCPARISSEENKGGTDVAQYLVAAFEQRRQNGVQEMLGGR